MLGDDNPKAVEEDCQQNQRPPYADEAHVGSADSSIWGSIVILGGAVYGSYHVVTTSKMQVITALKLLTLDPLFGGRKGAHLSVEERAARG